MALPVNSPTNEIAVSANLADISTASSVWVASPASGHLVRAYSCLAGAITVADATWVIEIDNVAVTGTVTVANASSAAGDVDSITYPVSVWVNAGQTIEFKSAGESSTAMAAVFTAVIRT